MCIGMTLFHWLLATRQKRCIRRACKCKWIALLVALVVILSTIHYWTIQSTHKLAVLIPFRDRFDELIVMVPHLQRYLQSKQINHQIIVINQVDQWRFNRAALLNVGFDLTNIKSDFDYVILHDVDLLPMSYQLNYDYPEDGPYHISSPDLHPLYKFSHYLGGILAITKQHYLKVNGMSNNFWGWGREDDEFRLRLIDAKLTIHRAYHIKHKNSVFRHIHDAHRRPRDMKELFNQRKPEYQRDRITGLTTLRYLLKSKHQLSIDGAQCTVYNVQLECNLTVTPWCQKKKNIKPKNKVTTNKSKQLF